MALEAAYAFDGSGSTVLDLSGNGRDIDLTGTNGVQVAGGQTGNALGKNGATMPVLPSSVLAASETDDRTLMLDVLGTDRAVWVIRWSSDALSSGIWGVLSLDGSTMQSRARRQSDSAAAGALTFGTSQAATWHNVCLTYVRSTAVLSAYWDGTLISSGVPSGWTPGQQLMVGADRIDLAEWSATGPAIDNVRIFSHALSAGEVDDLAGTPVTVSTVTGSGTVTAPTATVSGAAAALVSGAGSLTAEAAVVDGDAGAVVSGSGTVAAAAPLLAGAGAVVVAGQGSAVVLEAVVAGAGQVIITGSGVVVAPAAVVSGSDAAPTDTPASRTYTAPVEARVYVVPAESRTVEA